MGAYDATTKYLIESHAADWLRLAGWPTAGPIRVVDADLSTITSASDKLISVGRGQHRSVVHIEFQTGRDVRLDERVLAYNVLARRRHRVPVRSVVFALRPEAAPPAVCGSVRWSGKAGSPLSFDFDLIRVWTLPAADLLAGPLGTLPLAPVAAVDRSAMPSVIRSIRQRLDREVPPPVAAELWAATSILMGLRYNETDIQSLLRGVRHMRESVTYQAIVEEGRTEEGQDMIIAQGTHKFGKPTRAALARVRSIDDVGQLRRLSVKLLDVSSWADLLQ